MTINHKPVWIIAVWVLATILLAACGSSADSADTVDDAVTLLQDLKDLNVWETISDRLITLHDQTSYHATLTLQSGAVTDAGEFVTPLVTDVTFLLEVDDQANARITVTGNRAENGQSTVYLVSGYLRATEDADSIETRIYRAENDGFVCMTSDNVTGDGYADYLLGGIQTLFDRYGIDTIGMRTLAIVDRTDNEDATIIERAAIEYDLVAKVADAVQIAAAFDSADLQAALDQAGQFDLSGDLYLDEDTLALLRVTSHYTDLSTQQRHDLTFEITQWGDVADIALPDDTAIIEPCD